MEEKKVYHRPKNTGELRNLLLKGIKCEVSSNVSEMTAIMLRQWLNFTKFKVKQSKNPGWCIFMPI